NQGNQSVSQVAGRCVASPAGGHADQELHRHGRGEGNTVHTARAVRLLPGLESRQACAALPPAALGRASAFFATGLSVFPRATTMLSRCISSGSVMCPRISAMRWLGCRRILRVSEAE